MGKCKIPNEDVYKRISFLYQAAMDSVKKHPADLSICRYYVHTLKMIAQKQVLRLHPDLKRTMCKRCCVILIPGVTSIVRVQRKRQKQTVVSCLECGTIRRYIINPRHVPWIDRPDSWQDIVTNSQSVPAPQARQEPVSAHSSVPLKIPVDKQPMSA